MQIIPRTSLHVGLRQRANIAAGPLQELRESIAESGLLQPPVAWCAEGTWTLVAGERRLRAIDALAAADRSFHCNGQTIPPGMVPVLSVAEFLDASGRFEAELAENIYRVDLEWQDRCRALADLHALRVAQSPPTGAFAVSEHTITDTAREIVENQGRGSVQAVTQAVKEATLIARHLDDPAVAKSRNAKEAFGLVMKREQERIDSILAKRMIEGMTLDDKPLEMQNASLMDVLPKLEGGIFDLILSDPPYGVDAGASGFRQRTVHHHNYTDTVDAARAILQCILTEGFRLTKPRANLFLFTDIKHWDWLQLHAANMGWTPWRTPIIWQKSESEGLAPWGSAGFRHTYDLIFYATKSRGLVQSPVDILNVKRVPRHERIYAAEKPVELLRKLIECSTLPGERVLDPCAGSGSTLVACRETNRRGLGIELDRAAYDTAMSNLFNRGAFDAAGPGATDKADANSSLRREDILGYIPDGASAD